MKRLLFVLLVAAAVPAFPQDQHTYGPVKDDSYGSWYENEGSTTPHLWGNWHDVGHFMDPGWMTSRCISFYHWTYSNIPTEGTVTSVRIRFRVDGMAPNNFQFALNNINHNSGDSSFDYYDAFTSSNQLYTASITPGSDGYAYFDQTFSSGPIVTALNSAVQSGQYFFALGIQVVGSSIPAALDEIEDYDGNGSYYDPAVELTIGYTTPIQNYQFVNNIEGTENYGYLTIKDNTKGTSNSVSSGTVVGLSLNDNCVSTTNELPFDVNWNASGKTEKHAYWNTTLGNGNVLSDDFTANLNKIGSKLSAQFTATSPVTIQTAVNGTTGNGNISFDDPWYYYKDSNGNWQQSNQLISYSSPFVIQNNSTSSYGGVFLSQSGPPNWASPYYQVSAPTVEIINSYTAFFTGWTCSPSGSANFQNASSPTTAVEFVSSNAVVTANYSYSTVTYSSTIPSGTWPMAGSVTVPSGITLTGSSGSTLSFPSGSTLTVNGTLSGNAMTLNASSGTWTGVAVNTSGASVSNCTISAADLPISISGVSSASISGVTIDNSNFSSGEAISVSGSTPTITNVTINGQSGSQNGVAYVSSSGGTLSGCTIQNLGAGQGITIQGNSNPTISGNTIENNYYHGIACWSNGTATPDIESNTTSGNGSDGLVFYGSSAYLLNDASSNNNVGIYCESSSDIWTGGQSEAGGNTVTNNNYGIGASTNSTVDFGDYTGRWYVGTCNNIYGNTTYNAYASGTSTVVAQYNWWGQSPPDTSKFWTDNSSSTVDYTGALTSAANCPISGSAAQQVTLAGKTVSGSPVPSGNDPGSLFQFAEQSQMEGEYPVAIAAYRTLLKDTISTGEKERALVRLFNMFQVSHDTTIIADLESYSKASGELGEKGELLLGYAYESTKHTSKAESVLNDIISKYPGSELEKEGLILLASMKAFDTTAAEVSSVALTELVQKYGSSVDNGLLSALGANAITQQGAAKPAVKPNVDSMAVPSRPSLGNYPNPFNPTTVISYQLPKSCHVTLKVYDVLGREVETLVNDDQSAGRHTAQFNGENLSSGVYFYRLTAPGVDLVKKMLMIK